MSEKIRLERGMRRLADDELMHWKYIKRVRGKNGKYQYYYDNNTGTSKKKADVKPTTKSSRKSTTNTTVIPSSKAKVSYINGKHSAAIAAAQAAAQNTPMYQLKHGNLKQKVVAGYKIVKKFINKLLKNNIKIDDISSNDHLVYGKYGKFGRWQYLH